MVEYIDRKCIVCGKELKIRLLDDSTYEGGHFFGRMELPVGDGEYKKMGKSDIFGKEIDLVEWTGKKEEVEYWECDDCYYEDEIEERHDRLQKEKDDYVDLDEV